MPASVRRLRQTGRAQGPPRPFELLEATIPELQAALTAGSVTSRDLVTMYLARIDAYDQRGPSLNAISAINGQALAEAEALDAERRAKGPRGPLHGIPMIVKDNYETTACRPPTDRARWRGGSRPPTPSSSKAPRRRRDRPGQVEHARVRPRHHDAGLAVRPDPQPLRPRPQSGRLQRRHRSGDRRQLRGRRAWAATPAARSASPPPTTAWWVSVAPRGWRAVPASSRCRAPWTSAGRSGAPSPTSPSCSTRPSATTRATRRRPPASATSLRATPIFSSSPACTAPASVS